MKQCLIIFMLIIAVGIFAQSADTLWVFNAPQFANPFYETYSRNYLGVEAAGRGYTGAAVLSNAHSALINPAVMTADSANIFIEFGIKPPQNEDELKFNANYVSPTPLGVFGFSMPLNSKWNIAAMYNNPKSIYLEDFIIEINQGASIVAISPKYYLHQFSAVANYKLTDKVSLGMALHNQIHYFYNPIFLRSYAKVSDTAYRVRMQPGFLFKQDKWMVGGSALLPGKIDVDLRYGKYEYPLPLELNAGLSYTSGQHRLSGDFSFVNDSAVDEKFSSRYGVHLGAEKRVENHIIRAGYMFKSNVWDGRVMLAENTTANADTSIFWLDVPNSLDVKDNNQHFLTAGLGYLFKHGQINVSLLHCIIGENRQTQVNMGLSIKLNTFMSSKLLED
ncbi:MAG: hypothetical protein PHU48_03295 [Candidatus Cloacimonetes bacterium]|nr:hypothetical protein [Candidatus Cloacimonadota bacterium]